MTPMMHQWHACKQQAKDALLLFRLGDFYEAFYEDATFLSKALDVTLTQRQGIPMSGIPAHTAEGYIEKLVEKGFLVAIAEQTEEPQDGKGLVNREVVRIVSPGTLLPSFQSNANNFLGSFFILNQRFACAILDFSTGEFQVIECLEIKEVQDELFRRAPSELLISKKDLQSLSSWIQEIQKRRSVRITPLDHWQFDPHTALQTLTDHFQVHSLDGFGLKGMTAAITAAGSLLHYLKETLKLSISHIQTISPETLSLYLAIDEATQRHLELTEPLHQGGKGLTLLKLLDQTVTPMGARLLKHWVTHPLLSISDIQNRQATIEILLSHLSCQDLLRPIRDLERLMTRISTGNASPRDLNALKHSLSATLKVKHYLESLSATSLSLDSLAKTRVDSLNFPSANDIVSMIEKTLVEDPPTKLGEGKVIRQGVDPHLDELRAIKSNSQTWMANYQTHLREHTGIKNLKIIFSKTFGYCIEVSRGQAEKMPSSFARRQTLVNSERFISSELKAYEEKIVTAEETIHTLESGLYQNLKESVARHQELVQKIAKKTALLDVFLSLSFIAVKYRYTKPSVNTSEAIRIEKGRHPVIEASLSDLSAFIPNNTTLDRNKQLVILTGPNMAGKSTYMRQVALILILAQMGSFIPAQHGHIGIVDRIFSRIGASDDLSQGQSTFMMEMTETANILNNATPRSFVILDEIGRGTSTFDGISIAWAVAEHLLKKGCKTLFATHYWELTQLKANHSKVENQHVAVQESQDHIVFLRKIVSGSTDKSYGIHVARLAGLPMMVLKRAEEVLHQLENKALDMPKKGEALKKKEVDTETDMGQIKKLIDEIQVLNPHVMTPLEALMKLNQWKETYT